MAEEYDSVLIALGSQIEGMSSAVNAQSISQLIPTFNGDQKKFADWMKKIEKYAALVNIVERKALIAYQASSGAVSDFIGRFIQTNGNNSWEELKKQLTVRFGEFRDEQHALTLLQRARQGKDESVPLFAERLISLGEEAFPDENGPIKDRQLIACFIDGLTHDYLKMKVMREAPATLERAISIAVTEQNFRQMFDLRVKQKSTVDQYRKDREEPMEVDHSRDRGCFRCGSPRHKARDCKARRINAVGQQKSSLSQQGYQHVRCWRCRGYGHRQRECMARIGQERQGN